MAAAGVVVANPIIAPRADVQIPAVQLSSGSGDPAAMLDPAFLDAIAPAPPESTNPFSVLRQLISSLAADATYLGKNAIVDAFVAGVTAVSDPELTSVTAPFGPPPVNSPELAASLLPGLELDVLSAAPNFGITMPDVSATGVVPVVHNFVNNVVNDAGFVGGQLVAAAFAAGAVVAAEPGLIRDTFAALITGDLAGAVESAVKVVTSTLGPAVIILNALRMIVAKNVDDFSSLVQAITPAQNATAAAESDVVAPVVTDTVTVPATPVTEPTSLGRGEAAVAARHGAKIDATVDADLLDVTTPRPAAGVTAASTRAQADNVPVNSVEAGAVAVPAASPAPMRPSLIDSLAEVGQRLGAAVSLATAGTGTDSGAKGISRARAGRAAN